MRIWLVMFFLHRYALGEKLFREDAVFGSDFYYNFINALYQRGKIKSYEI